MGRVGGTRGPFKKPIFVPRHPFDLVIAEPFFPKVEPAQDDSVLTNCLVKKKSGLDTISTRADLNC